MSTSNDPIILKCVVCGGQGWLPSGFYQYAPNLGYTTTFSTVSLNRVMCRSCDGKGYIKEKSCSDLN